MNNHPHFEHRNVLGCWINDISSVPRPGHWPSIVMDEHTDADMVQFFDLLQQAGYNSLVLFGLFVARQWEVGFADSVSPQETM